MMNFRYVELIIKKRDGEVLSREEMKYFVSSFIAGDIPEYQMSSMLMAIFFRGMESEEIVGLTDVYINSGKRVVFPEELHTVDKHSTGGVGDKITLMLAPIVGALGIKIPMISGRGLGHTGGTLDKFREMVLMGDLSIIQQSSELVPADKKIYALRDVTGTVESYPLITASIMSKKIAEGAQNLAVDLKVGSGAFMKNLKEAKILATFLKNTGEAFGQKVSITFTNMNSPLGFAVGNGIEIKETIEYLKGKDIPDIDIITRTLAIEMIVMNGLVSTKEEASKLVDEVITSGKALEYFRKFIDMQGGNSDIIDDYSLIPHTEKILEIRATKSGYVKDIDSKGIGYALIEIGAGRKVLEDKLNYGSGAELFKKIGDKMAENEIIGYLHCDDSEKAKSVIDRIVSCYNIVDETIELEEIILEQW
ncbi:MAG: thymidine phosphorylase [Candidatus Cloacimonetes bacterium 4572_65]|nr:MAG: thymidine phosphorylase [Candidatus Cloacimonetes bacterium 4572_65]